MKKHVIRLAAGSVIGTAFVAGAALSPIAQAADNPFAAKSLSSGYLLAAADEKTEKKKDGKCGEAKCGADKAKKAEGEKAKDGKCGGDKKKDAKCGADKKKEGSCGGDKKKDASCGADKKK